MAAGEVGLGGRSVPGSRRWTELEVSITCVLGSALGISQPSPPSRELVGAQADVIEPDARSALLDPVAASRSPSALGPSSRRPQRSPGTGCHVDFPFPRGGCPPAGWRCPASSDFTRDKLSASPSPPRVSRLGVAGPGPRSCRPGSLLAAWPVSRMTTLSAGGRGGARPGLHVRGLMGGWRG